MKSSPSDEESESFLLSLLLLDREEVTGLLAPPGDFSELLLVETGELDAADSDLFPTR